MGHGHRKEWESHEQTHRGEKSGECSRKTQQSSLDGYASKLLRSGLNHYHGVTSISGGRILWVVESHKMFLSKEVTWAKHSIARHKED